MRNYKWIKITDINGETYEFEDCKMIEYFGSIVILFVAPLGTVRKTFYKRNIVSFEYLSPTEIVD